MSMANSLESRVPFLDYRLVEWALKVPAKLKINRHRNKYLVKKLGDKFLPREAIYRPKVGFGVPINEWLLDKEGMGRYLDLFYEPAYKQRGYINVKRVHMLIDEHLAKKANHCEILWNLINLELWQRIFIEKSHNI
jgi:asparagine synthase (glutamine-hydrolysing)